MKKNLIFKCAVCLFLNFLISNEFVFSKNYHDSLALKLKDVHDSVRIRYLLEAASHFQVINPDTAIVLAGEAIKLAETTEDTVQSLEAMVLLGRAKQNRSEFYESTKYFFKAVKIAEKWNDLNKLSSYHNSIGISFYYLKDYEKAIFHIQKAADIKLKLHQIPEYATTLGNLAGVLHQLGRHTEALKALKVAVARLDVNKDKILLGNLYNTFGSIYQVGFNKLDSAEFFYRKALKMVENEPEGVYKISACTNIGMICSSLNKFNEAEYYLSEALLWSKKLNRDIATISIYESLSNLYAKMKDYKKALEYKNLQLALKDSVFNADKEKVVANLEMQYQNEKGKQLIQSQKLEIEKTRNKGLWAVIFLILLLFLIIALIVYFKFQSRLQQQLTQAKETFFSNVVHEIRTPISMIQAPIMLLQKKSNDVETVKQLNLAEKSLLRLNELLNQMLLISKIDAGQLTVNGSFGNFMEFLDPVLQQYQSLAQHKNQRFIFNNNLTENYFNFDSDKVQKIIDNLLSNAIKYTGNDGEIGVELNKTGQCLTITIWDNGIGIDDSEKEKIFDRFYRSNDSVQKQIKGIGIGLALVKSLVEALQGTIEVQSQRGEGSTFTVKIPVLAGHSNSQGTVEGNNTVLLVEDDLEIALFNKELLENEKYTVWLASNGVEALHLLKSQIPDIIVSDLMMPVMDGWEFIREVRQNMSTEHIPVIMLSAKASPENRLELLKAGAQAYLTKPFVPDELIHLVSAQLMLMKQKHQNFKQTIEDQIATVEEKYKGTEPYTQKFFKLIFENIDNSEFTVEQLADLMATNRSHFQRKIKALTGYSPSELIKTIRLEKSKEYFVQKKGNITEVAYMFGFSSQSYFTKSFTQFFGITPSQFLQEHSQKI